MTDITCWHPNESYHLLACENTSKEHEKLWFGMLFLMFDEPTFSMPTWTPVQTHFEFEFRKRQCPRVMIRVRAYLLHTLPSSFVLKICVPSKKAPYLLSFGNCSKYTERLRLEFCKGVLDSVMLTRTMHYVDLNAALLKQLSMCGHLDRWVFVL